MLGEAGGNGNRFILAIWKHDDLHEMQAYLKMRTVEMEDALGTRRRTGWQAAIKATAQHQIS